MKQDSKEKISIDTFPTGRTCNPLTVNLNKNHSRFFGARWIERSRETSKFREQRIFSLILVPLRLICFQMDLIISPCPAHVEATLPQVKPTKEAPENRSRRNPEEVKCFPIVPNRGRRCYSRLLFSKAHVRISRPYSVIFSRLLREASHCSNVQMLRIAMR